jgi:hypothetical protein
LKDLRDTPGDEPVVGGAGRQVDRPDAQECPVKPARGRALQPRKPLVFEADRLHDIGAFLPLRDQRRNQRGRMLQVRIEHHDRVGLRMIDASDQRGLMAEAPRHHEHGDIGLRGGDVEKDRPSGPARIHDVDDAIR